LRFVLAQALLLLTAFISGECAPQAHLPSFVAMVMHGQDFVFMQLHTYTVLSFVRAFALGRALASCAAPRLSTKAAASKKALLMICHFSRMLPPHPHVWIS
jgi:hypothetical protein